MPGVIYVDASAVAKLCLDEPESAALGDKVRGCRLVSSSLVEVEVTRAARRVTDEDICGPILSAIALLALDRPTLRLASMLGPSQLRTLDAIHLASALQLGADLETFVTYDLRQAAAAAAAGLSVETPR